VIGNGDTLELQDNAGDNLFVTGDVPFIFPTPFSYGTTYSVTGFLPPTSQPQGCTIFFATAVVLANVSDVLVDCQHNDWGWVFPAGTPALDQYGTASLPTYSGVNPIPQPPFPAPNANTPGGRDFAMAWTDKSGNRWLFGGFGFEVTRPSPDGVPGYLNDMWVWPTTNPTSLDDDGWWLPGGWIPSDLPIICGSAGCFADTSPLQFKNRRAVYGAQGSGTACGLSFGGCTVPGGRWGGVTWTDAAGNLWMFGGQGLDTQGNFGLLNDIWEFDITSGPCGWDQIDGTETFTNCKWIWQGGSSTLDQPTTASFPGARWGASTYTDGSGNLWMFGGQGYDSAGNIGLLNDLWRYNIAAKTWTLVSGGSVLSNVNGTYGTEGTGASGNLPGGRQTGVLFADHSGAIWLFGGFGLDSKGTSGGTGQIGSVLNDLWKYDPNTGFWAWISGNNVANQNGVYGTQAISNATLNEAATSVPGARWGSTGWVSPDNGNLFLFGGFGYGSNTTQPTGFLNDVWEYDLSTGQWIWWKGSIDVNDPSTYITAPINFFQLSYTNNHVGARRGAACWLPDSRGFVHCFGGEGYAAAGGPYGHLNDVWRYLPFP
jgi:N-acetylneuraminic acid mutarotase